MISRKYYHYVLLLALFSATFFASCNKTKQHSNWLTGESWQVTAISIDGQEFNLKPTFNFDDCAIYDEICFGTLQLDAQGSASFAWQIRDKGNTFELSDQTENIDSNNEIAVSFTSSFSGIYKMNHIDKKNLEIESSACKRYPGKKVLIQLSKQ